MKNFADWIARKSRLNRVCIKNLLLIGKLTIDTVGQQIFLWSLGWRDLEHCLGIFNTNWECLTDYSLNWRCQVAFWNIYRCWACNQMYRLLFLGIGTASFECRDEACYIPNGCLTSWKVLFFICRRKPDADVLWVPKHGRSRAQKGSPYKMLKKPYYVDLVHLAPNWRNLWVPHPPLLLVFLAFRVASFVYSSSSTEQLYINFLQHGKECHMKEFRGGPLRMSCFLLKFNNLAPHSTPLLYCPNKVEQ